MTIDEAAKLLAERLGLTKNNVEDKIGDLDLLDNCCDVDDEEAVDEFYRELGEAMADIVRNAVNG